MTTTTAPRTRTATVGNSAVSLTTGTATASALPRNTMAEDEQQTVSTAALKETEQQRQMMM